MFSLNDYQTELVRLQTLNQKYAFLMSSMQYVKIRQAGAPGDLKFDIMEKNVTSTLENLINQETSPAAQKTETPKKPTELGLV